MPPAARIVADATQCNQVNPGAPPVPHVGGPIVGPGAPTVLIGFLAAALQGDTAVCVGPPDTVGKGASTVIICGKSPARLGDTTAHGAKIKTGCPTVNIGDTLQGAALMKAGAPLVKVCEDPNAPLMV
jgi:uncharacterized Zn-binding protein involved in type VI secretion